MRVCSRLDPEWFCIWVEKPGYHTSREVAEEVERAYRFLCDCSNVDPMKIDDCYDQWKAAEAAGTLKMPESEPIRPPKKPSKAPPPRPMGKWAIGKSARTELEPTNGQANNWKKTLDGTETDRKARDALIEQNHEREQKAQSLRSYLKVSIHEALPISTRQVLRLTLREQSYKVRKPRP